MNEHLIIETSRDAGGIRLTIKMVPDELHQRILNKFGSYRELGRALENSWPDEYEEFLHCKDVEPAAVFSGQDE